MQHPFVQKASLDGSDPEDESDATIQKLLTEQALSELAAMLDAVKSHLMQLSTGRRLSSLTNLLLARDSTSPSPEVVSVCTLCVHAAPTFVRACVRKKPYTALTSKEVPVSVSNAMASLLRRRGLNRLAAQLNLPPDVVKLHIERYMADTNAGMSGDIK